MNSLDFPMIFHWFSWLSRIYHTDRQDLPVLVFSKISKVVELQDFVISSNNICRNESFYFDLFEVISGTQSQIYLVLGVMDTSKNP